VPLYAPLHHIPYFRCADGRSSLSTQRVTIERSFCFQLWIRASRGYSAGIRRWKKRRTFISWTSGKKKWNEMKVRIRDLQFRRIKGRAATPHNNDILILMKSVSWFNWSLFLFLFYFLFIFSPSLYRQSRPKSNGSGTNVASYLDLFFMLCAFIVYAVSV
jgi:hypothetical protein